MQFELTAFLHRKCTRWPRASERCAHAILSCMHLAFIPPDPSSDDAIHRTFHALISTFYIFFASIRAAFRSFKCKIRTGRPRQTHRYDIWILGPGLASAFRLTCHGGRGLLAGNSLRFCSTWWHCIFVHAFHVIHQLDYKWFCRSPPTDGQPCWYKLQAFPATRGPPFQKLSIAAFMLMMKVVCSSLFR